MKGVRKVVVNHLKEENEPVDKHKSKKAKIKVIYRITTTAISFLLLSSKHGSIFINHVIPV